MSDVVGVQAGPCEPWCELADVRGGDPGCEPWNDDTKYPDALLLDAIDAASDLLFQRSARRFPGVCTDTVWPAGACSGLVAPLPDGRAGVELRPVGHRHPGMCCDGGRSIELGSYPVLSVTEVRVDGDVLAQAGHWQVIDWRYLVRVDGGTWPCCNTVTDAVPRLAVDFSFGHARPSSGQLAAVELARELAKGVCRDQCAFDRRVEQLTREGVSITIPGLVDSLRDGRTGLAAVDLFLWAHNPNGLQRRGRIIIPGGGGENRRRTFP